MKKSNIKFAEKIHRISILAGLIWCMFLVSVNIEPTINDFDLIKESNENNFHPPMLAIKVDSTIKIKKDEY